MLARKVRGDYAELNQIAEIFGNNADQLNNSLQRIKAAKNALSNGDWIGRGATAFYGEMDSQVLPALQRLVSALQQAKQVMGQISGVVQQAEVDAAAVFKMNATGDVLVATVAAPAAGGNSGGSDGAESLVGDAIGGLVGLAVGVGAGAVAGFRVAGVGGAIVGGIGGAVIGGALGATVGDTIEDAIEGPLPDSTPPTVTPAQAQQMFDDMKDEADIPFKYNPDGCYARAYEMNKRIEAHYGVTPHKVWAFDTGAGLNGGTYLGQPVTWSYVAPVVNVLQPDGTTVEMVIDPSMADKPISREEWKNLMNNNAVTYTTEPGQAPPNPSDNGSSRFPGTGYWPGTDPSDVDQYTKDTLADYKDRYDNGLP